MADYSPVFTGGVIPLTATTAGAVTGGRVLAVLRHRRGHPRRG